MPVKLYYKVQEARAQLHRSPNTHDARRGTQISLRQTPSHPHLLAEKAQLLLTHLQLVLTVVDMSSNPSGPDDQLRSQWSNPGDILSLLLLIGGDIVQKALAQFVGVSLQFFNRGPSLMITPVAFSFGWVAYAFTSLLSIVGDGTLMPDPDTDSIVINCSNAYVRENHSWILGRLLRDYESAHEVDPSKISLRIDLFKAVTNDERPDIDLPWTIGWVVIVIQQVLAAIPWIIYGDWAIFMVTVGGTLGAQLTGALHQWKGEKWAGRRIHDKKPKVVCVTRGNGHHHAMIIICDGKGWDLEAFATAAGASRWETRFVCIGLTIFWTLLLITVSGLKQNSWFLIGVGGIGMLQNIYAAGTRRTGGAFNVHLEPYKQRPTIIGRRQDRATKEVDDPDSDAESNFADLKFRDDEIKGVAGALMALETEIPKAGASLLPVFFPGGLKYEAERFRFNREKRFWKNAFRKMGKPPVRVAVETKESQPVEVEELGDTNNSIENMV
jgi:hypothetical protein